MSLWKVPLLLSIAYGFQRVLHPPNVVKKEGHKRFTDLWTRDFIAWGQFGGKVAVWFTCLGEVLVICASHEQLPYSHYILNILSHTPKAVEPERLRITSSFIVGWITTMFAILVRLASYHSLGQLFTFELSIQDKHKLVTSGPYNIVRHPSYVGSIAIRVGTLIVAFCPGSWLYECGWLRTIPGLTFLTLYVAWDVYVAHGMVWRTAQEDKVLQKEFGKDWEEWAGRVRYRLMPGVY